jgi:hypothetical protein
MKQAIKFSIVGAAVSLLALETTAFVRLRARSRASSSSEISFKPPSMAVSGLAPEPGLVNPIVSGSPYDNHVAAVMAAPLPVVLGQTRGGSMPTKTENPAIAQEPPSRPAALEEPSLPGPSDKDTAATSVLIVSPSGHNEVAGARAGAPEHPTTPAGLAAAADGSAKEPPLCGGKVCRPDQFCCGPPECGHCASKLTGPNCPKTCS